MESAQRQRDLKNEANAVTASFFLYARKSTDSEERQILSIEAQLTELRELAKRERIHIKQEFTEAMTAKTPGRPIFNNLLDRIERGEANGILAWHPDRLARNSVDGGRVIYLLDCQKLRFLKCPTFWFENTPQGRFMLNVAFGQAKYYVDNLSENIRRGMRQKLRNGGWPRRAPLGYLNNQTLRKVVVDPQKGPLVRRLFELYSSGRYSLQGLRKLSAEWGLVNRHKAPLANASLEHIFSNTFYFGLMRNDGELYEGNHEPLITKALFENVQSISRHRGRPKTKHKHTFPYLGLATCLRCGCSITAERQRGHAYYHCTKRRGNCHEPYLREEEFGKQVRAAISSVALPDPDFQKMLASLAKERDEANGSVAKLKSTIQLELTDIQSKLDRLLDAQLDGLIAKSEYLAKKETLLRRKLEIDERMTKLEHSATDPFEQMVTFLTAANQAGKLAISSDLESQRDFLKNACSNARLAAKNLKISYRLPWSILEKNGPRENWWSVADEIRTYFESQVKKI